MPVGFLTPLRSSVAGEAVHPVSGVQSGACILEGNDPMLGGLWGGRPGSGFGGGRPGAGAVATPLRGPLRDVWPQSCDVECSHGYEGDPQTFFCNYRFLTLWC